VRLVEFSAAKTAFTEPDRSASEGTVAVMLEVATAAYLVAARREVWRLEAQLNGLAET
jgi:hypothetical protein